MLYKIAKVKKDRESTYLIPAGVALASGGVYGVSRLADSHIDKHLNDLSNRRKRIETTYQLAEANKSLKTRMVTQKEREIENERRRLYELAREKGLDKNLSDAELATLKSRENELKRLNNSIDVYNSISNKSKRAVNRVDEAINRLESLKNLTDKGRLIGGTLGVIGGYVALRNYLAHKNN